MTALKQFFRTTLVLVLLGTLAHAGGPLPQDVQGPNDLNPGKPFHWDSSQTIKYRVDTDVDTLRLVRLLGTWEAVTTAKIKFENIGPILQVGAYTGGNVDNVSEYNALVGDCEAGTQSPIINDANGAISNIVFAGDSSVIGFAQSCLHESSTGLIKTGFVVMVGFAETRPKPVTAAEFDAVIIHETGHMLGLDHSQINVGCYPSKACGAADLEGIPTMFPYLLTDQMGSLGEDDKAWISYLYPNEPAFSQTYGFIKGRVLFADGKSGAQGVNVIARRVGDPRRGTGSAVSGLYFTSEPGQTFTSPYSTSGNSEGSHDPQLVGYYEIPVIAGTYTVEIESIHTDFNGGSSVGPLDPPVPNPGVNEFWNSGESATDDPALQSTITVTAGQSVTGVDIILNYTPPRFDQFEDSGSLFRGSPFVLWAEVRK